MTRAPQGNMWHARPAVTCDTRGVTVLFAFLLLCLALPCIVVNIVSIVSIVTIPIIVRINSLFS